MKKFHLPNNNISLIIIIVLVSVLSSTITMTIMKQKEKKKETPTTKEVEIIDDDTIKSEETSDDVSKEEEMPVNENKTEEKKTDTKKENKTETKQNPKSNIKSNEESVTSDEYVCQSGWELIIRDNRYECKKKVSDGDAYSTPVHYYCEDGSTPKNGSCTVTKEFDAGKNYECNSDESPMNIDYDTGYMECGLYAHSKLYLSTACEEVNEMYKTCSKCKSGYYYDGMTCVPNSASNCPAGYTKLEGNMCVRPATFKGYMCGKDEILNGDKCIVKILEPAKTK